MAHHPEEVFIADYTGEDALVIAYFCQTCIHVGCMGVKYTKEDKRHLTGKHNSHPEAEAPAEEVEFQHPVVRLVEQKADMQQDSIVGYLTRGVACLHTLRTARRTPCVPITRARVALIGQANVTNNLILSSCLLHHGYSTRYLVVLVVYHRRVNWGL